MLLPSYAFAQLTCDIAVSNDTTICNSGSFGIEVTGDLYDVRWSPALGLSDDDIPNPIATINNSITYIVTNKLVTTNILNNGDFDAGSTGFTNDYVVDCPNNKYGPDIGTWKEGAPNDGQYCVVPATSFAFALGGWQSCADHTGNGGNLMYVNGDITKDAKIWCQTVNVTPNTDYQFSTWITSVYDGNPAQLAFSINGNVLGSPFTAIKNTCQWSEFFEIWDSNINTSAQICIVNQNTVSNGNDFALDDITFQKVCIATDSVEITVNPGLTVNLGADKSICPGDSVVVTSGFPSTETHLWNSGSTDNGITIDKSGRYTVSVLGDDGCVGRDTININDIDTPFANLPDSFTACFAIDKAVELRAQDTAANYIWSTGEINQSILISKPGAYIIDLSNTISCASSDTIIVSELCNASYLYLPNTFTPNNDGKNDIFYALGENLFEFNLKIYNRWGEFLFESTQISQGWDGRYLNHDVASGVYVYSLKYKGISPINNKEETVTKIGHINLIR